MAAVNIFAGDLLFKNFGVTRHGRVIFYDYDEIEFMIGDELPPHSARRARPEDEMAAEPLVLGGAKRRVPRRVRELSC